MNFSKKEMQILAQKILKAESFILTTHKNCDADGLGSIIAFHYVLSEQGKKTVSLSVDEIPPRYDFMNHKNLVGVYKEGQFLDKADLALIFDTNDPRLVEPLYSQLKKVCGEIIFIDHHNPLNGPASSSARLSGDQSSASTGELCYSLFECMKAPVGAPAAKAIYTSIIFDTHNFRSSKNLSRAFLVCSKLCGQIGSHNIFEKLFCSYSDEEWAGVLKALNNVQYNDAVKTAVIEMNHNEFKKSGLKVFHLLDVLDFVMKREAVEAGVLSVETSPGRHKISLRSKRGGADVSKIAEFFGGGGHSQSAGAALDRFPKVEIFEKIKKSSV